MNSIISKTFNDVDNHVLNLYRFVSGLFNVNNVNSKFSDVQLNIGSKTFYCHKFVLGLGSKYFANLSFWSRTGTLRNIDPDYFYDVLQFMYTGEILLSTNNIESILTAADILCMDDLKRVCLQFLCDSLNIPVVNAPLYRQLTNKYGINALGDSSLVNVSEEMMKVIINDDNLEVKNDVEVCDLFIKWLQVQTEAGHKVHPDQLLPLVRWSGISLGYVKSKLLHNTILTSNPAAIRFLTKVITYLESGVQFENLQTFYRSSTGLDNSLLVIGLDNGIKIQNEVHSISLQNRNKVKRIASIPTMMNLGAASCLLNNHVFITGIGDKLGKEMWTWNKSSSWSRCADMLTGRQYHCVAALEGMLYVLGGWVEKNKTALRIVECYNTLTSTWISAGQLIHAVWCAPCVTYKGSIYVFGGLDDNEDPVTCVQVYDPVQKGCTLMNKSMPGEHSHNVMIAVLWETSVILLGYYTCFIYNFETDTWQERIQFKTGVGYSATALDNSTVYIAGGGILGTDDEFICKDEIRSVSVLDIVDDKTAVWNQHAQLTKPAMIVSYLSTSLAI